MKHMEKCCELHILINSVCPEGIRIPMPHEKLCAVRGECSFRAGGEHQGV